MRFITVACFALSALSTVSGRLIEFETGLQGVAGERDKCDQDTPGARKAATKAMPQGKPMQFANAKAKEFYVDGKSLPDVNFDVGPSYSGKPVLRAFNYFWLNHFIRAATYQCGSQRGEKIVLLVLPDYQHQSK